MKNYLNIHETKSQGRSRFGKVISSPSQFFKENEYLIISANKECMTLQVPTIDYSGKMSKITKCRKYSSDGWYNCSLMIDVPCGTHFEFDEEESNEDRVVVYFNQKEHV